MVKIELEYNPYILETKIKFNGQSPKINSLVEKYLDKRLQSWLSEMPEIFYQEMNGYDFDLEFTGTKLDYVSLKSVFNQLNNQVRLNQKNESVIADAHEKSKNIDEFLTWLEQNPNQNFNLTEFKEKNSELLEDEYSLFVIGDIKLEIDAEDISVEYIHDIEELSNLIITEIPLVFYITSDNERTFRKNLQYCLHRNDVQEDQLFFIVDESLNSWQIKRSIKDLGIKNPQLIKNGSFELLNCYLETYPITSFVREIIKLLREDSSRINKYMGDRIEQNREANKEVYNRQDEIEQSLNKKAEVRQELKQIEYPDNTVVFMEAKEAFLNKIDNWKKKKAKMTSDQEAYSVAKDFNNKINQHFADFVLDINEYTELSGKNLAQSIHEIFIKIHPELLDIPTINISDDKLPILRNYALDLVNLNQEVVVNVADNLLSIGMSLLKMEQKNVIESSEKLEIHYFYDEWRKFISNKMEPILQHLIQDRQDYLDKYKVELLKIYNNQLNSQEEETKNEKQELLSKLSGEEKIIQNDSEWLQTFNNKLREIERG